MSRWVTRAPVLIAGWYLMMAYPLDKSPEALFLSIAAGTLGALVIGITCYRAGRADA